MVAPARPAAEPAGPPSRRPGEAGQSVSGDLAGLTPAPWPAIGVRIYAAPTPAGPVMVVPEGALADLRDTGYVLFSAPAPVRVDLLMAGSSAPGEPAGGVPFDEVEVVTLLRRAAAAATLGADVASQRQTGIGPSGPWYATLLAWGWLLLVFAAQSPAHAIGALWLIAGLPAMRNGYRRRRQAWDRHGAAGLHAVAGAVAVRPLPHAGLARLATVLARTPDDPSAALRAVARACPDAGVAGLVPFYAALAAGAVPAGVWSPLTPRGPVVEDAASVPSAASLPAGGSVGAPADEVPGAPAEAQQGALPDEAPGARHGEASLDPQEAAPAERPARAVDARPAEVDAGPAGVAGGRSEGGAVRTSSTPT